MCNFSKPTKSLIPRENSEPAPPPEPLVIATDKDVSTRKGRNSLRIDLASSQVRSGVNI
jgi:hypothetical protein